MQACFRPAIHFMDIFDIVADCSILSALILLGLAIFLWRKIPDDIGAIRWVLIAAVFSEGLGIALGSLGIRNLWVYDVFMFIQFTILLYIFSSQFQRKNVFIVVYAAIAIFYLIALFFLSESTKSLVNSNAVDGLVLVIVSIVFFYKLLSELKIVSIHRLPILWIAFATLFYYSGNLFVFLAASYLEQDPDALKEFWLLHNVLNIIKNILFGVALWQSYRTMRSST